MDPISISLGIIYLVKKLARKFDEIKIYASVFENEIAISCTNLLQAANSLNTADQNLGTLSSEHIESPIFKHINKQLPLLKEGRQIIRDMLKWLAHQAQSLKGSWAFVIMWKWKNLKPSFDWLGAQMQFLLLSMLVINSTAELNIVAEYLATHGNDSSPCRSRFKTLNRSIKDYERQIKKLQEAQNLREGQLPLVKKFISSSQKYMRDSMDMLQTLRKTYTPPAAVYEILESHTTSTSTTTSSPSSSTASSSTSSSTGSPSTSSSASPPLRSSSKSSPADHFHWHNPSPRPRSRQDGFHFTVNHQPRLSSRATIARPQNPMEERQEPTLIIDSRHNEDVFNYYIKSGDSIGPARSVLSHINIRIPINIISIYKAQELDLPIENLEPEDPRRVRFISSENRASNWKIVGKTLDVEIYSGSNAHTKPKVLSLFVIDALLNPPIILGQPFLKQSKRNHRH